MGFHNCRNIYVDVANAIKSLDIDRFQALTNNVVIDFKKSIDGCGEKSPKTLLDYFSVMLKAKNRDPYLQSLFVTRLWEMFNTPKSQSPYMKEVALDLLPLMFLRERSEINIKRQLKLYFKLLDEEPHDVFLSKIPNLINLFQNPFFNNSREVIKYLKDREKSFDLMGFFKVKEQCYYQKNMLLEFLSYIEKNEVLLSFEAIYKSCGNISFNSQCHCVGDIEISWLSYSPKEIQIKFENIFLKKLGLSEDLREYIPLIVASKNFRDLTYKGDVLVKNYLDFIERNVQAFYVKNLNTAEDFFKILKRLNIPQESYLPLEKKHLIEKNMKLSFIDSENLEVVQYENYKL